MYEGRLSYTACRNAFAAIRYHHVDARGQGVPDEYTRRPACRCSVRIAKHTLLQLHPPRQLRLRCHDQDTDRHQHGCFARQSTTPNGSHHSAGRRLATTLYAAVHQKFRMIFCSLHGGA